MQLVPDDGAADGETVLELRLVGRFAGIDLIVAGGGADHAVVGVVGPELAAEGVGSGLGDGVDDRARGAELGAVVGFDDLELLDRRL